VLVAAAPIIAFVLNGFRVVSLVLFPDSHVWSIHTTQGIVTFAIGALCIALLDRWLDGRLDAAAPADAADPGHDADAVSRAARPPVAAFAWIAGAALATVLLSPFAQPTEVRGPDLLPATLAGFRDPETLEPDRLFLGSVRFTRTDYRSYVPEPPRAGAERVAIFVGEDAWRERSFSIRSPKTSFPGRGFVVEERSDVDLVHGYRAERLVLRGDRTRVLAVRFHVGVESAAREALRAFLALERSPFARPGHGFVVRISTELEPGPQGIPRAERRLRDAVRGLDRHLDELAAWKPPQRG
jgi:hypothetical protein